MATLRNGCHKGRRAENPLCVGLLRGPTESALSHTFKDKIMWRQENCAGLFGSAWAGGCLWLTFSLMVLCCWRSGVEVNFHQISIIMWFIWMMRVLLNSSYYPCAPISPASDLDIAWSFLLQVFFFFLNCHVFLEKSSHTRTCFNEKVAKVGS